jgi:hypothetical protein
MSKQIAKADKQAMLTLYASELSRQGLKTAGEPVEAPQALTDHAKHIELLESVLSDDKNLKGSQNQNDPDFD